VGPGPVLLALGCWTVFRCVRQARLLTKTAAVLKKWICGALGRDPRALVAVLPSRLIPLSSTSVAVEPGRMAEGHRERRPVGKRASIKASRAGLVSRFLWTGRCLCFISE